MDIKQVNSAIMFGTWTDTELSSMIDAVKFAKASLAKSNKRQFSLGSVVKFTSTKNGLTYEGKVEKIAIKYITVATAQGRWRVPANMLTTA
jgi:small-conductance mechanosensitive channel